jgi:transcriptional regulator with XRE-family HTH domain
MQEVDSGLRALMQAKGLDQTAVARLAKVSQATVSRALKGGTPKRRGKAYMRLCNYIQEQQRKGMFPILNKDRVHEAINRIWDASKLHADAIAKVVEALDNCAHRR